MVVGEEEGVAGIIAIAADGVGWVVLGWDLACLLQDVCLRMGGGVSSCFTRGMCGRSYLVGRADVAVLLDACGIGGIEVRFHITDCERGILNWWALAPERVPIRPMAEMDPSWCTGYVLRRCPSVIPIDIVTDAARQPIEAVLVVVSRSAARWKSHLVYHLARLVVVRLDGIAGILHHEMDWPVTLFTVLLCREDLEVDFLAVVAVEEECAAGAVDVGRFHRDAEATVQDVVALRYYLC